MEWFVFTSRLICHIYERLRLHCKDVYIYSLNFLYNLPILFFSRRYYKSLWLFADAIHLSQICQSRRTTVVLQAPEYIGGRQL